MHSTARLLAVGRVSRYGTEYLRVAPSQTWSWIISSSLGCSTLQIDYLTFLLSLGTPNMQISNKSLPIEQLSRSIDADRLLERYRKATIRIDDKSVLMTNFKGSLQA